jgi:hypothetical protein
MPEKKSKTSATSARAEGADTRNPAASSRRVKSKTKTDAKLIKKLFGIDALDWARYPDDHIVFISPEGKKLSVSQEEIEARMKSEKTK